MWLGAIAYVVAAGGYAGRRRAQIAVRSIDIRVADASRVRLATADSVRGWLAESGPGLLGRPVDAVDTREVERSIGARDGVRHVRARTDLNGNLHVKVAQRVPLMRVQAGSSSGPGHEFWVTRDGWILPFDVRRTFGGDTMLVRGAVPVMFDPSRGVEYAGVERRNFADYLAEFTTHRAEYQRLTTERAKTWQELRAARSSGPKRFWGRARKDAFARAREERVADLDARLAKIDAAIAQNKKNTAQTRENEKKSQENLAFLPKLANFVEFVADSDFWSTKIARIDVLQNHELKIVPVQSDATIIFGALDGTEIEKLNKLEAFWRTGEMARYRHIDVKYNRQIVCRAN